MQNKFNFSLESHENNDQEFLEQINRINNSGRDSSNKHIRVQLTQPIKRPKSSALSIMAKHPKSNNQRSSLSGFNGGTTNMQDSSFDTNRLQNDSILFNRQHMLPA